MALNWCLRQEKSLPDSPAVHREAQVRGMLAFKGNGGWQGCSYTAVSCNSGVDNREGAKVGQHLVNEVRI